MGLKSDIEADILEALADPDDLGDVAQVVHVTKRTTGVSEDPLSPSVINSTSYEGRLAVVSYYDAKVADGVNVIMGDKDVVILQSQLGCVPEPNDTISIQGDDHDVISVTQDAASVTWQIQARGRNG